MTPKWSGKRVLILGAARQGLALARWLAIHGAQVTLSDSRSAENLRVARKSLEQFSQRLYLELEPSGIRVSSVRA